MTAASPGVVAFCQSRKNAEISAAGIKRCSIPIPSIERPPRHSKFLSRRARVVLFPFPCSHCRHFWPACYLPARWEKFPDAIGFFGFDHSTQPVPRKSSPVGRHNAHHCSSRGSSHDGKRLQCDISPEVSLRPAGEVRNHTSSNRKTGLLRTRARWFRSLLVCSNSSSPSLHTRPTERADSLRCDHLGSNDPFPPRRLQRHSQYRWPRTRV
ncbi:hypothetical protein IWZ03DRAFT_48335 [Phyllosticta citriasiana]|uniref:Uncharacterized protein n=1 Tax=Phyllosticta citriasiana TaxID=595635 RepID=A0ABR1KCT3_9PEZI